jgi:3,4-dihydroxy 2-butanone 4-phosphate synthase/GTP cyclohydrolase II
VDANHALGFAADMRDYKSAAHILFDLGVRKVRLMTNNPDKVRQLEQYGLEVTRRVPIEVAPRRSNRRYLRTKRARFGHLLSLVAGGGGERKGSGGGDRGTAKRRK